MTPEQRAVAQHLSKPRPTNGACGCMGPRDGDPFCHCDMLWTELVDGTYYRISETRDLTGITLHAKEVARLGV